MKGGITSGVIYPRTVCQLALRRKLVKVGGTSAGAIAAAAAAAAEYARDAGAGVDGRPDVGYPRLASLPNTLAQKTNGHTGSITCSSPNAVPKRCTDSLRYGSDVAASCAK